MLHAIDVLFGFQLACRDGLIGRVKDVYFDDELWHLRYLVVDTGNWLPDRKVLIPIASIGMPRWDKEELPVDRSKVEVETSPSIGLDAPVSRRIELEVLRHYDWAAYWGGPFDPVLTPSVTLPKGPGRETVAAIEDQCHLRSAREIRGYAIAATDGEIGHADDLVVESKTWELRYLVIKLSEWLPGHRVLFALPWVRDISYHDRHLTVDATVAQIEQAPRFDPGKPIDAAVEVALFEHYHRTNPWA